MISVVAFRWKIPLFEVEKWKFSQVKRHYRAVKYEIEKHKEQQDDTEELT